MTGSAVDGLVVVDKPAGLTSHDVVARIRRLAATRRVGHAGTLDPMATGVLVVGVGRATRLLGYVAGHDKEYDATLRLGVVTSTDDAEGEVLAHTDAGSVEDGSLRAALSRQAGDIEQVPSAVSAVKVDGERAYARVRRGEKVDLPARPVHVESVTLLDRRGDDVDIHVVCSSGTYVRAIARDVGADLGVGAHLTALRRTRVGAFGLDCAHTLDDLAEDFAVLPLAEVATRAFPIWRATAEEARRVGLGQRLAPVGLPPGPTAVLDPGGDLVALVEERDDAVRPTVVFPGKRDMS